MAHAIFDETQQSNGLARSYYDTFDVWLKGISAETGMFICIDCQH
jgi:hypothetical protein